MTSNTVDTIAALGAASSTSFHDRIAAAQEAGTLDVVSGRALADKSELVGVPFIVTGVTFRYGGKAAGKNGAARDYVSLEITTDSNVDMVLNDGSTGIRRQIVSYLVAKGLLTLTGDETVDSPRTSAEGMAADYPGLSLLVSRGLRVSHYSNEYADDATTYYLS
jgi:hypothetical protein